MFEPPVFDRAKSDVDYAGEHQNDPVYHKGAFGYTDMNRITGNMHHVAKLSSLSISVKKDWQKLQKPFAAEVQVILNDLSYLRDSIFGPFIGLSWNDIESMFSTWEEFDAANMTWEYIEFVTNLDLPDIPERPIYHFEKINDIERLIYLSEERARRVFESYNQLGAFELGGIL